MKKLFWLFLSMALLLGLVKAQGFEDLGSFKTPSDNIHCVVFKDSPTIGQTNFVPRNVIDCQIITITAKIPPQPKDCNLDWGYRFGMYERGKSERSCYGDLIYNPKHKVLAYGKSWSVGGFVCDVTTVRLRCQNRDKHGFELSKAVQKLF